ncbi:MAG: type IV pilus modification protein PilV [Pseudomonas sp.]|nr:type IV pilus modification protein PilV [Pseudomonas sp.]
MSHVISSKALPQRQRGVGLIEVLITVLVLAIGLLGLSALQLASLKNNQSAMQRSLAVVHSYTMVEAIRAEPTENFNISFTAFEGLEEDSSTSSFTHTVHSLWRQQLKANLGIDAKGSVTCTEKQCTIIVQWDDSPSSHGDQEEQLITEVWL